MSLSKCFEKFRNHPKRYLRLQPQPLFRAEFVFVSNSIYKALPGHPLYGPQDSYRCPGIQGPQSVGGGPQEESMGTVSGIVFLRCFEKFRNRRKECLRLQPQPLFRTEFGFLANSMFEAFPGIRKSKDPRILVHGRVRWGSVGGPFGSASRVAFWTFSGKFRNRPKVCL